MTVQAARSISLIPGSAITRKRFVALATDGQIDHAGNGADAIGVSLEDAALAADPAIPVALLDGAVLEVEAGAAIATPGLRVMSDASGRAITAVGATVRVLGVALDAAGGAGEIIRVIASKAAGEFVA